MREVYSILPTRQLIAEIGEFLLQKKKWEDRAIIFPGRRPGIYLREYLAERINSPFFPPSIFSMDDFIKTLKSSLSPEEKELSPLQAVRIIYQLMREIGEVREVMERLPSSQFISWSFYLYSLFEEFEVEMVKEEEVERVVQSLEYEGEMVESARILGHYLLLIWRKFRQYLRERKEYTRGMAYREIAERMEEVLSLLPWKEVLFAGFYRLTASEEKIMRRLWEEGKLILFWEDTGSFSHFEEWKDKWRIERVISRGEDRFPEKVKIFASPDLHSQMFEVREILKELLSRVENPRSIGIVLPDPSTLFPLLEEVMSYLDVDYNITLGYVLKKFPLFSLFHKLRKLQRRKRGKGKIYYPLREYLSFLLHPYVKNLEREWEREKSRMLLHSLEDFLSSQGVLWICLEEVEEAFFRWENFPGSLSLSRGKEFLKFLHKTFFYNFEGITSVRRLAQELENITLLLLQKSIPGDYSLSYEYFSRFLKVLRELQEMEWEEGMDEEMAWGIILTSLEEERVPFTGTPLKGIQIMGMLEARNLSFPYLLVLDVNEGILPGVRKYDPLLPPDLRKFLNLPDYRRQEDLYHYQFRRLISRARELYLFYQKREEERYSRPRSRFLEEIIWEKEKREGRLEALKEEELSLPVDLTPPSPHQIPKSEEVQKKLREFVFSPSSIDLYLRCPLRFYYRYMLGLRERVESEEWEGGEIGILLHNLLHEFFSPFKGTTLSWKNFPSWKEMSGKLRKEMEKKFAYLDRGTPYLLFSFLESLLKNFYKVEKQRVGEGVKIMALEEKGERKVSLSGESYSFSCIWDRVEERGGRVWIIDYKTLSPQRVYQNLIPTWQKLSFPLKDREEMRKRIKSFQLPIYIYLWVERESLYSWDRVDAFFYPLLEPSGKKGYFPDSGSSEEIMRSIILPSLASLLEEILSPDIPFIKEKFEKEDCSPCPYASMCLS